MATLLDSDFLQTGVVIQANSPHQAEKAEKEDVDKVLVMSRG